MAYSNKSDAINKLTAGYVDNNSFAIYHSDNNHDLNTIYYTNSAKTNLLPAGNYVLPTNFRTLWLVVGNDGKLTQLPEFLITSNPDTSWINDTIYSQQAAIRVKHYRTDAVLSGDLKFTDNNWTTFNYGGYTNKAWVVNNGPKMLTSPTNIDFSEMKGYDLMIYTGAVTNDSYKHFVNNFVSTIYVHIAQDINRQTIFNEGIYTKIYFFKPDYWFPKQTINGTTFSYRNLFIPSFTNSKGLTKTYHTDAKWVHDVLMVNKTTTRTPTRFQRGIDEESSKIYSTASAPQYLTSRGYTNVDYHTNSEQGIRQDQPSVLWEPLSFIMGVPYDKNNNLHQAKLTALYISCYTGNFTGTYTSKKGVTVNFADCNPYQWRTTMGSGISNSDNSLVERFVAVLTTAPGKVETWFWDMEDMDDLTFTEVGMYGVFESFKNAKAYIAANNLSNIDTKITFYTGGVYNPDGKLKWDPITTANVTSSQFYLDYHNYYKGNADKSTLGAGYFYPEKLDYIEYFRQSFVNNYFTDINNSYFFYLTAHNNDISRKLIESRLGPNHQVKIQSQFFHVNETVGDSIGMVLKAEDGTGTKFPGKPDIQPDTWQSLGAWTFGLLDGLYMFEVDYRWYLEDYQDIDTNQPELYEIFYNDFSSLDWFFYGKYQMYQNKDILEANTEWQYTTQLKAEGGYTNTIDNYPVMLFAYQRPLIMHKLSADGKEALVLAINPFNNGYTKSTVTVQIINGQPMTIDMWGTYTTVMRVKINN